MSVLQVERTVQCLVRENEDDRTRREGFFFGDAGREKPRLGEGQVLTRRIGRQKVE